MIGFTLPLYVLLGLELILAADLLLPLPLSRPAILVCKGTKTDVGRSVFFTIFFFLLVLAASPVYDIWALHVQKERSAESLMSQERRETEASSNLSLTLTGTCMAMLIIVRQLGMALAEVDELRTKVGSTATAETEPAKTTPVDAKMTAKAE